MIRLAAPLTHDSVVDGPGIRTVIWTQGCIHHCPNCHNPQTHDMTGGTLVPVQDVIEEVLQDGKAVTFSGGDPFCQPEQCGVMAKAFKQAGLNVWAYSGWTFENLLKMSGNNPGVELFLENIDVLVDGPFVLEKKNLLLTFRGSENQRLIDVQSSLRKGETVIFETEDEPKGPDMDGIFI